MLKHERHTRARLGVWLHRLRVFLGEFVRKGDRSHRHPETMRAREVVYAKTGPRGEFVDIHRCAKEEERSLDSRFSEGAKADRRRREFVIEGVILRGVPESLKNQNPMLCSPSSTHYNECPDAKRSLRGGPRALARPGAGHDG